MRTLPRGGRPAIALALILLHLPACAGRSGLPVPKPAVSPETYVFAPRPVRPPAVLLTGGMPSTVYWLLGTLDEYLGRRGVFERSDVIERFYCNEHEIAQRFRRMLTRFAREQGLADDVSTEIVQECLVFYRSPLMAWTLDSMYRDHRTTGMFSGDRDPEHEITALWASPEMFEEARPADVMAYLQGAYYRYGKDGSFAMANAAHKADLIADLLESVGARNVRRETSGGIPNGNFVYFEGSPALMQALTAEEPEPR